MMSRIIYFIICSILFSTPFHGFKLNKGQEQLSRSNGDFPDSNGIIDIEPFSSSNSEVDYWISTGSGLGTVRIAMESLTFHQIANKSNLPVGGNPALFSNEDITIVSGVTQEYSIVTESYEPKGTGIGYSQYRGTSWTYMPQPIWEEDYDNNGNHTIQWGNQELTVLAVTTDINNVSYDVGVLNNYVYTSNWAGGLRRFDYTLDSPIWEIIPLPIDSEDSLFCNLVDEDNYILDPRDPGDGGNHNHKGFSILGTEDYLWVGTANGINRGTIHEDCINWYHQTTASGLSGDWVVGIEQQTIDEIDRIWAITWSAGEGQSNSISYTVNDGEDWQDVEYFSNQNIKIYNLDFDGAYVYAASEKGLFYSEDLIHWEKVRRSWGDTSSGDLILDETVYSVSAPELLIGTGDGLLHYTDTNTSVYRFWNNSAASTSDNQGFTAYPNPFFISENGVFNQEGHVRFIYYNPYRLLKSEIDIYDFTMNHVINLSEKINISDETTVIWDGRDILGNRVVNGTYFCKLSIDNKTYWTKLLVIN